MRAWLMRNDYWRLVSGRETKPTSTSSDALTKWEIKAEKAAGEIYLLVENDQRVHFRGFEEVVFGSPVWSFALKGHGP